MMISLIHWGIFSPLAIGSPMFSQVISTPSPLEVFGYSNDLPYFIGELFRPFMYNVSSHSSHLTLALIF